MSDVDKLKRRVERERIARKEAERLLEEKSTALYEKNMELYALSESLEKLVAERTMQMQNARDDALKALKVKTDFIANMSHELRTPMNGVLGILALLQNENLSAEQRELIDIAESSGQHLLEVINDILDFSKIEADKITIELAPVEVRAYVKGVLAPFSLQAEQKGIAFNYFIEDSVEPGLVTDKLRLTQVITNLLSNAIKFTDKGEVRLQFKKLDGHIYQIAVSDTGIGISEENIKAVFAAFEQADTSITREFGGTGLGMNITKRLIDMLNGKIHVESTLGKGTTFFVEIPMDATTIESKVNKDTSLNNNPDAESHLLLVEDHKVNQLVAQRLLESWGFKVTLAENGAEAIEAVKTTNFDGILMDLQMPIMGGIQACQILRKEQLIPETTPIIAMTAHNSEEHVKECFDAGMQDHVSKPLNTEYLLSVLRKTIGLTNADSSISTLDTSDIDIQIAGLNAADSLQRVGGDWPLLYSLIGRFFSEFEHFYTEFYQLKLDANIELGITMLHKMKGGGGNLGMERLSSIAAAQERILATTNTWPGDESLQEIQQLLDGMKHDYMQISDPSVSDNEETKIVVEDTKISEQITKVATSLKQDVFTAEDALKELFSFELSAELVATLKDAEAAIQCFDIQAATLSLTKAKEMME